jgi:type III pantothenate kinase
LILAIDIGNTNIEIGVLSGKKDDYNIIASGRYYTTIEITPDQLALFILNFLKAKEVEKDKIGGMIFSSVVPPLNNIFRKMFKDYFSENIIEVDETMALGIKNCYKNPREVGSDRLVNAAAVYKIFGKNAVIVDMGTATTLCVLTDKGEYMGGAIMPGIWTATGALTGKAARLPAIKIQKREKLLSEDTASAIEAGVYYSNYFALKGMMEKLASEAGFKEYITIGTGGYTFLFKNDKLFDHTDPILTLKGLKIIYDLNKKE